jgi:CheY-like chemotaxis protein
MNILIVDDEAVSSAVLKHLVTKLPDCDVHAFTDPSAALIWCLHNAPDLAIVDYSMPTIDGIEFARRLRALPYGHKIPIVMVSAMVDTQVVRRALRHGVNDFIHKPFDFLELQTCVSEILGLRAMRGQLANKALLASARALSETKGDLPRLLDRNLSRARLGGDQELLAELARIFSDTVPAVLRVVHNSIVNGDFDAVLAEVILLKGAVASIEAPDVLHLLSTLEQHARKHNPAGTVAAFAMVQALTERLLDELASLAHETPEKHAHEIGADVESPLTPARDLPTNRGNGAGEENASVQREN